MRFFANFPVRQAKLGLASSTVLLACGLARAEVVAPAPPSLDAAANPPAISALKEVESLPAPKLRYGPVVSIGVPHPIELGAGMKSPTGEYSFFATAGYFKWAISSEKRLSLSNLEAGARWHPWRGPFFAGLIGGYQILGFTTKVPSTDADGTIHLNTLYLTPQVGFNWLLRSGLTLGFDVGFQLPVAGQGSLTAESGGSEDPDGELKASLERSSKRGLTHFANLKLPQITLIRVGWLFD